jgi:hypothetical protein
VKRCGRVLVLLSVMTGAGACASVAGSEATAVYPPRQLQPQCGERYVWLPFERTIVLTIPVNSCWSEWLALPPAATGVEFRADGVLDVQVSGPDGISIHEGVSPVGPVPQPAAATSDGRDRVEVTRVHAAQCSSLPGKGPP